MVRNNKLLTLKDYIQPLKGQKSYNLLLDTIGDVNFVFIGESTHGTHEFYNIRAEITKRLIKEKSFNAIAIEGDWPDAYRINKFIRGNYGIKSSIDSLVGFKRFPTWMWRNQVILEFIDWIHDFNLELPDERKVGFYGLDLYSLNTSIEVVIKFLEKIDSKAASRARKRYACFDHFKKELQSYGYANALGIIKSCENEVVEQLIDLHKSSLGYLKEEGICEDEFFNTEQNARLVKNAEKYYRSMFTNSVSSWNIRDTHMFETLENLSEYLSQTHPAKIVVWAHNSHVGDARATEIGYKQKEVNLGQLAREKYKDKTFIIGFSTYTGTVTAATEWDSAAERKHVRPALAGSYEEFFHKLDIPDFIINFKNNENIKKFIPANKLERAIGVIYLPQTERYSHYFHANITDQFDALIYIDRTHALKPIEVTAKWHKGEVFETFPSGL